MTEDSELWRQVAIAEQMIASAQATGMAWEEGRHRLELGVCYYLLEQFEDAAGALELALPLLRATEDVQGICQALCFLGTALVQLERYRQSLPLLEEALDLARSSGGEDEVLTCLSQLGLALTEVDRPQEALAYLQEALGLLRRSGDHGAEVNELGKLGNAYTLLNRPQEALDCHEQALALAREIGDRQGEAYQLGNLAADYTDHLGRPEQGVVYLGEALAIFRDLQDRRDEAFTLINLAGALAKAGRTRESLDALTQGRQVASALGDRRLLGYVASQEGKTLDQEGHAVASVAAHERALLLKSGQGEEQESLDDLTRLGMSMLSQGLLEEALAYHQRARELARRLGDRLREAQQLDSMANVLHARGAVEASWLYRQLALPVFREAGDLLSEGRCYVNFGRASIRIYPWGEIQGNKAKALAAWRLGYDLLSCVEPAEAEFAHRKIETLKAAEGEQAFRRLSRASEAHLRWLVLQRGWLTGDVLQFALRADDLESYLPDVQAHIAPGESGTPLHDACQRGCAQAAAGMWREARVAFQEALTAARERDDSTAVALLLGSLGELYGASEMWEESVSCFKQAAESFHAAGDRRGEMKTRQNLGEAQLKLLLPGEALESLRAGWFGASLLKGERAPAVALRKMGVAHLRMGDPSYAKRALEDALEFLHKAESGDAFPEEEGRILACLAFACLDLGFASKAVAYLEQAVLSARAVENRLRECECLCLLATAHAVAGRFNDAMRDWTRVLAMPGGQEEQPLAGQVSVYVALTHLFQERPALFLAHVRRALDLTEGSPGAHRHVQQIMDQFAVSMRGQPEAYERARSESGQLYIDLRREGHA
jgi:tetratricopeptide (TPR) repeat protein